MKPISSLEELHGIELEILKEFHSFCIANNLRYSLAGGTLLGAVRHKGFIPWDDDIDVMMPRPDYDRFIRLYHSSVYAVHAPDIYGRAFRPFAKIVDSRTILSDDDFSGEQPGVWMDVFPIDGAFDADFFPPSDSRIWKIASTILLLKNLRLFSRRRSVGKNLLLLAVSPLRLLPNGLFTCAFRRIAARADFETAPRRGCLVWGYGRRETLPAHVFSGQVNVSFEGGEYRAIAGWHEYLSAIYGDYMIIPPLDKQVPSHALNACWKDGMES